ncbi:1,2-phenylacetyl-CoA epoxidase subunit PaaC [uncultured Methylobacterium sp.]|jgi:ring-1,2-phenylacetyl-CoA epoxidase subunit PaaC|uniref:1,2-phenylacetyl-CoA epoxidase subunit PaaC n=1 Tax=uncultured Methylobacterium sp. TaxID=157278 RepID=UPI002619F005|nr:1,2-phenylacetyl-CoA epoxidase subunit PaaC [uncultured Methylobacterium sp.]
MTTTSITLAETPLLALVLRRADDALILGHRLSEWCGHGPMLEEDVALANIALDCVGQARSLYDYAATLDGRGLTEDDLAYRRDVGQYRNCLLVEQPNGDFAATIVRQVLASAFLDPYWRAMTASADPTLAAIAAKAEKETAYHLRHAAEWLIRLGDGTPESHERAQAALDDLWPYSGELMESDDAEAELVRAGIAVDPAAIRPAFDATVAMVLREATLTAPAASWRQSGGRQGRHSEHLGFILADLQYLQRAHPGATW